MVDHDKILRLRPQFTAYAYALCGDACDGDDLVQEAIARALESGKVPDALDDMRHWMFRVIRNLYIDRQRRKKVRSEYSASYKRLIDGEPVVEEDRLGSILIRQAMEALSPNHREVLYLVDVMGMSYAEAASVMAVAPGTVMSRLSRARKAMVEQLDGSNVRPMRARRIRKT